MTANFRTGWVLQSGGRCSYALCCCEFYPFSRASLSSSMQPSQITRFPITTPAQPSSSSWYMHSSPQKMHGFVIFSPHLSLIQPSSLQAWTLIYLPSSNPWSRQCSGESWWKIWSVIFSLPSPRSNNSGSCFPGFMAWYHSNYTETQYPACETHDH